jgi:hypothetical protein
MTFYHGTVSTFQASILKYGLWKGGDIWYRLAKLGGSPGNFGQSAVWCCDSFEIASHYARLAAHILRTKMGQEIRNESPYIQQPRRIIKASPFCDPNANPIVFAIELDQSEAILSSPGKFRVPRTIPPEALTLVRG